ncbi:hypothetical protein [Neochlamydia sp. TUME1]|uniref:hypothetical protein n=1 Tax=Neochlamydia sp. TUME1 TaxID=1478174 RepID=UPI00138E198D|nr:hypothetical protein [Neochlamydia sp. TUME1]
MSLHMPEEVNNVVNRLKKYPNLLESIRNLLNIAARVKGIEGADDAEFALIL